MGIKKLNHNIRIRNPNLCIVNEYYFVSVENCFAMIYDLKNNWKKISEINCNSCIQYLEFHPKFNDIFITALKDKEVKIWKINQKNPICIFKGHNNEINISIFNPVDLEIVASASLDKTIKIWNVHGLCLSKNILLSEDPINMKWSLSGNSLGFIMNENFIVYGRKNIKEQEWKQIFFANIAFPFEFIILNEKFFFIINYQFIEKRDFHNNIIGKIEFQDKYSNYCLNEDIIFLFCTNKIYILNIYDFNQNNIKYSLNGNIGYIKLINKIIFENKVINNFIAINIFSKMNNIIEISIKTENKSIINSIIGNNKKIDDSQKDKLSVGKIIMEKEEKEFINKIIPIIFNNKEIFHYSQNIKEKIYKLPKYLENEDIKNEMKNLSSIFKRKKEVEEEISIMEIDKNPIEQYKKFLKLLIKDNTNEKLLKAYLKFIKEKETQLNYFAKESFEDEIIYYECLFAINDPFLNQIKYVKKESEFQKFLNLLNTISTCNDLLFLKKKFSDIIDSFRFFNQPINYVNNELFHYRNRCLIIFSFKNINKEEFEFRKEIIKYILNFEILKDNNIINDPDKISFLIIIILYSNIENYKFYLNMLKSLKYDFNNKEINSKIKNFTNPEYICIDNLKYLHEFENKELYNFDYLMKNPPIGIDIKKIKLFIKNILKSKVFKEIMEILYEDPNFISIEELIEYCDNTIKFIPFRSNKESALTDKFTNMTYIFSMDKNIENLGYFQKGLLSSILKNSIIIEIIIHEISHKIYSLYFYSKNNNIPLLTPRKNENLDGESGQYFEILLFGKIINSLNIPEALFILNENNYNKSLTEFTIGFNELKIEDLFGENNIFKEFNIIQTKFDKNNERENLQNIMIKAKDLIQNNKSCYIKINNKNDIFGMKRF